MITSIKIHTILLLSVHISNQNIQSRAILCANAVIWSIVLWWGFETRLSKRLSKYWYFFFFEGGSPAFARTILVWIFESSSKINLSMNFHRVGWEHCSPFFLCNLIVIWNKTVTEMNSLDWWPISVSLLNEIKRTD